MYQSYESARSSDPSTSHSAAIAAAEFAGSLGKRIHKTLQLCGPMDPEQIGAMLDMEPYSVRKRLADLHKANQAEPTGEIVNTRSGRSQRVWRAL